MRRTLASHVLNGALLATKGSEGLLGSSYAFTALPSITAATSTPSSLAFADACPAHAIQQQRAFSAAPNVPSPSIQVITDATEMRSWSRSMRAKGLKVAFVPTMGYLHEGHVSLVRAAKEKADVVVASVYVNPTQFRAGEDFDSYPHDAEGDRRKLAEAGCSAVFEPKTLYYSPPGASERSNVVGVGEWIPGAHETWVTVEHLQTGLCGITRPTFFRGVATVVTKLFHIVEPDVAVFGKKDYQQWRVITRMVRDLDFPIEIVGLDTKREPDGLAMSSRNVRLKPDERQRCLAIYQGLKWAKDNVEGGNVKDVHVVRERIVKGIEASGGRVDYVSIVDQENLRPVQSVGDQPILIAVAAFYGSVRLIDNMEIGKSLGR